MSTLRVGVNVPPGAGPSRRRLPPPPVLASVARGRRLHAAGRHRDGDDENERGRTASRSARSSGCLVQHASPVRSSADPQSSEQADSTSPLSPKRWTKSAIRIAGSATWPSVAAHECAMTGHGPVSVRERVHPVDLYGVVGPGDRRDERSVDRVTASAHEAAATTVATGVSMPCLRPDAAVQRHARVDVAVRRQPGRLHAVAQVAELVAAEVPPPDRDTTRASCSCSCRKSSIRPAPSNRPRWSAGG